MACEADSTETWRIKRPEKTTHFFLGLTPGEFVVGSLCTILGASLNIVIYGILPWVRQRFLLNL